MAGAEAAAVPTAVEAAYRSTPHYAIGYMEAALIEIERLAKAGSNRHLRQQIIDTARAAITCAEGVR